MSYVNFVRQRSTSDGGLARTPSAAVEQMRSVDQHVNTHTLRRTILVTNRNTKNKQKESRKERVVSEIHHDVVQNASIGSIERQKKLSFSRWCASTGLQAPNDCTRALVAPRRV